jgi:hypothetical protein
VRYVILSHIRHFVSCMHIRAHLHNIRTLLAHCSQMYQISQRIPRDSHTIRTTVRPINFLIPPYAPASYTHVFRTVEAIHSIRTLSTNTLFTVFAGRSQLFEFANYSHTVRTLFAHPFFAVIRTHVHARVPPSGVNLLLFAHHSHPVRECEVKHADGLSG